MSRGRAVTQRNGRDGRRSLQREGGHIDGFERLVRSRGGKDTFDLRKPSSVRRRGMLLLVTVNP